MLFGLIDCFEATEEKTQDIPPETKLLVRKFPEFFQTSLGVPPARPQDHLIPVIEGSKPVTLNPYKCSYLQRNEIERMVREMLDS